MSSLNATCQGEYALPPAQTGPLVTPSMSPGAMGHMSMMWMVANMWRGVYLHVSPHHGFSSAHSESDIDRALDGMEGALEDVKQALAVGL
jgi:hypothetical protein